MRTPILQQTSCVYNLVELHQPPESRRCEVKKRSCKHTIAVSPSRECWAPCSDQSKKNYKQFGAQLGLAQQLQTPNLELSGLQAEVSHLRTSVARNPSTEYRDAENLRYLMAKNSALGRDNIRQSAEIERFILSLTRNGDGTYSISKGRRARHIEQELRGRRHVSRIRRYYSFDCRTHTHTAGDTSQSTPQNLSVASTVSSSALGSSQLTA